MLSRLVRLIVLCLVLLAVPAAGAAAAQRYASPTGVTSGPCDTPATACTLPFAITGANDGDEVIVSPDPYSINAQINITHAIAIHGPDGQQFPQIMASTVTSPLFPSVPGITLRNLYIDAADSPLHLTGGLVARRIYAVAEQGGGRACAFHGSGTLTDSVCWAPNGVNAVGVGTPSGNTSLAATIRNVTAVGSNTGMYFDRSAGGTATVDARNVIADGTIGDPSNGHYDVFAVADAGGTVSVTLDHSSFGSSTTGGTGTTSVTDPGTPTNQDSTQPGQAPLFTDAANGDFHQVAGSPTIDAGVADPGNGPADIDGEARTQGFAPDIGADEFPNANPTAVNDSLTVAQGAGATPVPVLANDTDPDGGPKLVASVTQPAHGTAAITGSGSGLTYQPAAGYCGADSFTYTLNGGSTATISITVTCSPDTTAPNTKLRKKPAKVTRNPVAKFRFGSTENGSTFRCKLDKKAFRKCPVAYKKTVTPGGHVLRVKAVDAAGNADKTPAVYRWKVLPSGA